MALANDPDRRLAILAGHLHVEEHDVRLQPIELLDGINAIAGLANDLDILFRFEKGDHAFAQHRMIVDDQNTYRSHETPLIHRSLHGAARPAVTDGQVARNQRPFIVDAVFRSPIWVIGYPFGRASLSLCEQTQYLAMARPIHRNRFPAGDIASLVLRLSLGTTLAAVSLSNDTVSTTVSISAAVLGCLIGSGLFTRAAAGAGVVLIAVCDRLGMIAIMPLAAEAISLVLVGSGAFSLDALVSRKRLWEWR